MKNVLDDIQAIRIRVKTKMKERELLRETQCRTQGNVYFPFCHMNGETSKQLLSRLRYQLYKREKDWNDTQRKRWYIIKKTSDFADIFVGYTYIKEVFDIYDSS